MIGFSRSHRRSAPESEAAITTLNSLCWNGTDWEQITAFCSRIAGNCSGLSAGAPAGNRVGAGEGNVWRSQATWPQMTVSEAFRRFAGWQPEQDPDPDRFDRDLVEKIEPQLGFPRPCFLMDYPAGQAALARLKEANPAVAERFELYWAGLELANGFSELTDPVEQSHRFAAAREQRRLAGRTVYPLPETFLQSLKHLQPCAGIALGIDRLVLLLADAGDLDQVVAFPPELA